MDTHFVVVISLSGLSDYLGLVLFNLAYLCDRQFTDLGMVEWKFIVCLMFDLD